MVNLLNGEVLYGVDILPAAGEDGDMVVFYNWRLR